MRGCMNTLLLRSTHTGIIYTTKFKGKRNITHAGERGKHDTTYTYTYIALTVPNYPQFSQLLLTVDPFTVYAYMHFRVHGVSVNNS